ncbi:hypothetical protein GCM10009745_72250 [Kribbella yunnanensis]|uniref:IrrE N-terminal-like domain-containing protein n=1 Tax=Kribbella yunnanensis TaxID=190194 RepID=A0ABP4UWT4_9ACTN
MSNEDRLWDALLREVERRGYTVVVRESASSADAFIDALRREIVIADRLDRRDAVARLAHEIGHLQLHSGGRSAQTPSVGLREIEAELFAYGVLVNNGIEPDRSSVDYISDWVRRIGPLTQADFDAIEARTATATRLFVQSIHTFARRTAQPDHGDDGVPLAPDGPEL